MNGKWDRTTDDAGTTLQAGSVPTMLVVEPNRAALSALVRQASRFAARVAEARTVTEALERLGDHPDLILFAVRLPGGDGLEIARAARELRPRPIVIALSGRASASEAFQLAKLGVAAYLPKPVTPDALEAAFQMAAQTRLRVRDAAIDAVGRLSLADAERDVRRAMYLEALARAGGNSSRAAELLGVTRQAVQHHLRTCETDPDGIVED